MDSVIPSNLQPSVIKKILVVHPYLNDGAGGGEEVLLKILEALIERKQDISLLGKLPSGSIFDNLLSSIKQIPYGSEVVFKPKRFSSHMRLFRHLNLKNKLRNKVGKVDLEICTQYAMCFIGSGKNRVAYIHFPNMTRMQKSDLKHRWLWNVCYWPVNFQLKRQVKKIDLLMCNSHYTQKAIMDYWGRDSEIVYPPVDVEDFKPAQKEPLVVSIGRFDPDKNYEMVVRVAMQMPGIKFVIIGRKNLHDPYYDKIAALKPDNMDLNVNASRTEVSALLSKAKIYLHSMVGEHFGISVGEAMAAGCVPVVHNSGGPKEIIGSYGFIYNNIEECVKVIGEALQSKTKPSDIAEGVKMFHSDIFKKNFIATLEDNGLL
jgi:glycosyltransferase involved in cell wall biosynthesis